MKNLAIEFQDKKTYFSLENGRYEGDKFLQVETVGLINVEFVYSINWTETAEATYLTPSQDECEESLEIIYITNEEGDELILEEEVENKIIEFLKSQDYGQ